MRSSFKLVVFVAALVFVAAVLAKSTEQSDISEKDSDSDKSKAITKRNSNVVSAWFRKREDTSNAVTDKDSEKDTDKDSEKDTDKDTELDVEKDAEDDAEKDKDKDYHHHHHHHHHHDDHDHHGSESEHEHGHEHGHDENEEDHEDEEENKSESVESVTPIKCMKIHQNNDISGHFQSQLQNAAGSHYTLAFWIKPLQNPTGQWRSIFHYGNQNVVRTPGLWFYPSEMKLHVRTGVIGNWNFGCDPSTLFVVGQLYHIAVSVGQYSTRVYINGKQECRAPLNGQPAQPITPQRVYLGDPWHQPVDAVVSDLRFVLGRAATAHEIKEVHDEEKHSEC